MDFDVPNWLNSLGLDQYADAFTQNDVDAQVLPLLTNDDLKEIGVSLGHRKIILASIQEHFGASDSKTAPTASKSPSNLELPAAPVPAPDAHSTGPKAQENPSAAPDAERRHLTVFFADLVGSTELTNRFDAEDMRTLLQIYQDTVAGAVSYYGGYVAKYLGDGLLVFFGWPRAYEDHAVRAIRAGLDTVQRVKELRTPDGTPLAVRVGIASGEVVVGDAVGENTYEQDAMTGPILNLTARIQAHAAPNSVILAEEGSEASLHQIFEFSSLGPVDLKGFDAPRTLMQVVAERDAKSRFRASHRESPNHTLVGRDFEKGILHQSWQHAQSGHGEVVLISGEAGIGKSRLTEAFLGDVEKSGDADIVRLNCSPYLSSSPFHPVAERISQDAGVEPGFDDDRILEHVRSLLEARQGLDHEKALPVYAAMVAPGSALAQQILELPPQEQRDITIQTMINTIKVRSTVRPVILYVEDAHWIDPSTNALLERIRTICADLPLMVLITHRSDWEMKRGEGDSHVRTLQLRRFSREHIASLVRDITGQEPDDTLLSTIVEKTDGIPLFVEEFTRAILKSGELGKAFVPSSLKGTLMSRLDAVSRDAKKVALMGSVIGRELEPDLLSAAMNESPAFTQDRLDELCSSGLVYESGYNRGHFVFRHALIRDTAYQSMLSSTRRAYHANVASALLQLRSAEVERRPELVARHLTEAEEWPAAFERWRSAAEMALARSASQEAMENAKETLNAARKMGDSAKREDVIGKMLVGRSYDSAGRLPDGIAALRDASEAAREIGDVQLAADAANHFADTCMMAGEKHNEAIRRCLEALNGLTDGEERRRCRLMGQLARAYLFNGQFSEGKHFSQECMELAAQLGDHKSQFSVMMMQYGAPLVARQAAEVDDWRKNLEDMHEVAKHLNNIDQGRNNTLSIFVGAEMADRTLMDQSFEQLKTISKKENHLQLYWVQTHARAMIAIMDGDFEAAEKYADEAVKIGRETHGEHVDGVFGVQMFTIRREQNRLHEVAPVIKRLMTENPEDVAWKPGFGVIAAELGYTDAAERILNEMADYGFELAPDAMYSTTLSYLADICVMVENRRYAPKIFELLAPYEDLTITAGATTVCTGAGARRLGNLAGLMGEWSTAEKMFQKAISIDTEMSAPPWIAHSKAAFAHALRRRGRKEDVERAFHLETDALEIAQNLSMVALRTKLEGTAS
jgi:predicted ATPase/class 3 adenylate cyclase